MAKNQYKKEPLKNNVEEMFIGPFGSSLKNECFVDEEDAYCMVYEQKHAIQKTLDGKNRFVDKNKYYELKRFTIKPGDIIVSCRGTIGETFIVPENAPLGIMHPSIMKIRLKPNVYNIEYFNLLLKNRLKDYNKSANGSGIKMAISATELGKELFPIPPMDEQQRTSKIFLMVNHLILLRQQQLAKLDELVKARFVEMFGDPVSNPFNWPTAGLGKRCEIITGNTPSRAEPENYGTFIEWIKSDNINTPSTFLTEAQERLSEIGFQKCRFVESGSLLMTCIAGSLNCIGNVAVANRRVAFNQQINAITPTHDNVLYLYWLMILSKPTIHRTINMALKGILSKSQLSSIKFPFPPLPLQNQFAAFVERVDQQKQTVQQSLDKLELMKKALMQEYLG